MRIAGSYTIDAPREDVWKALHDPAVLARTLPGCESLEVVGPDRYAATLNAGVASIKGTYKGEVELGEKVEPERYAMKASGAGGPGTVQADATVTLHDDGGSTRVEYDAEAVVGGMIGGVGQRMIVGVAKKTAGEFFSAVESEILHGPAPAAATPAAGPATSASGSSATQGQVFSGTAAPAPADDPLKMVVAVLVGACIALAGVWLGRRTAR